MKRAMALFIACLLVLSCSCTRDKAPEQPADELWYLTAEQLARYIVVNGCRQDESALERLDRTLDEQALRSYLTEVYGLEDGSWTDCAIYRAGGSEAFEIAVLRMGGEERARQAADALTAYIGSREGDFTGYEPEQAAIVHDSLAVSSSHGDAALLICQDPESARDCFLASYDALRRVDFVPPNKEDMTIYDTAAILAAWDSGDASSLSEKDAAILELAAQVLDQVTDGDMTPCERERAVYRWITGNVHYDQDHYDKTVQVDPDSYNPYGPLHNGKGVCLGVASTFQLFMDMTGVECITVVGASRQSTSDHAWNMVRLDGRWYCVDPTWDLGDDESVWGYFNVTSERLASTDHQWDYAAVPEAVDTDGGAGS